MPKDDIVPVTQNVLADLTVEELEQRLEMQLLGTPDANWCLGVECGSNTVCDANCGSLCAYDQGGS